MRNLFYFFFALLSEFSRYYYRKRLRVLAYHNIPDAELFAKQLKHLKSKYNIIGVPELLDNFKYENKNLPDFPLLITFDDGDRSVLEYALPELKKNNIPACIFIITELINSDKTFWNKEVFNNEIKNGRSYDESRKTVNDLKLVSNTKRLQLIEDYLPVFQPQLKTAELKILENANVFIGNHSHSHPMFDKCTQDEIADELNNSKIFFENAKIGDFHVFAYPNGNWDHSSESMLKSHNINLAFLFDHKINPKNINPMRISRIRTNADMSVDELKVKVSGLHSLIQQFKR